MKKLELYLAYCKRFENIFFPKLTFKKFDNSTNALCLRLFNIDISTINKACSFLFFILNLLFASLFSLFLHLIISISLSFLLSFLFAFYFSRILFSELTNRKRYLNIIINFIKLDYQLIRKSCDDIEDYNMLFLKRLKTYKKIYNSYLYYFYKEIQCGKNPEDLFGNLIFPSHEFNYFIRSLVVNSRLSSSNLSVIKETALEKNFRIQFKEIDTKMSILFFIGLFFPIGLCFFILLLKINLIFTLIFIPILIFVLHFLNKNFIEKSSYLIGKIYHIDNIEKEEFEEILLFLKLFAINLQKNSSPENSFINSFIQLKGHISLIKKIFNEEIVNLVRLNTNLKTLIKNLSNNIKSLKISLILDIISYMLARNSKFTGKKIDQILDLVEKYNMLEEKMLTKIQGQKFKLVFFLIFLPFILGFIGGMLPIFINLLENVYNNDVYSISNKFFSVYNLSDIIIIFLTLFFSNITVDVYFSKIVFFENRILIIIFSCSIFLISFFISLLYTPMF